MIVFIVDSSLNIYSVYLLSIKYFEKCVNVHQSFKPTLKSPYIQFTIILDQKQQMFTLEKLELENILNFCINNDLNNLLIYYLIYQNASLLLILIDFAVDGLMLLVGRQTWQ